jgi:hypothetical protein
MRKLLFALPLLSFMLACSDTAPDNVPTATVVPVEGSLPTNVADAVTRNVPVQADAFVRVGDVPTATQRSFFHEGNAPAQRFTCPATKDTVFVGQHGTRLHVEPGTFVDPDGEPVSGLVRVTLREALDPYTIVNCGLYTTYEGQPLQSGGMVEVLAFAGERQLLIAKDRSLGVEIPARDRVNGMSLFTGSKTDNGIEWVEPGPIQEAEVRTTPFELPREETAEAVDTAVPVPDVSWTVKYYPDDKPPAAIDRMMCERFTVKESILRFPPDSMFILNGWNIRLHPGNERCEALMREFVLAQRWGALQWKAAQKGERDIKGTNYYRTDPGQAYIFRMKRLGWANIDCLMHCPNTRTVDLITEIQNAKEFDQVYVGIAFPEHRAFLPGYLKTNGTYGFSHNDHERTQLPVGDKAVIIATAYRNGTPWCALVSINIEEEQHVEMLLHETSAETIRKDLMATL